MQKVLQRRVFRDLKENFLRYLALGLLIVICMYIVVSLVGSAETVITQVENHGQKNNVEDGEFSVFVPLDADEVKALISKEITLEPQFYYDYILEDTSTIRVFCNREKINLIELDEGTLATNDKEIVIEKRYAKEHNLTIQDTIAIGSYPFTIVGIGSVPDYDAPFCNFSDSTVDSNQFGMGFVEKTAYDQLAKQAVRSKSEQYIYAYQLNDQMTNEELKETLKDLKFSLDSVEDEYFKEYWEETAGKKEEFKDGAKELLNGSIELSDGLDELSRHNNTLQDGSSNIFDLMLKEVNDGLKDTGMSTTLTEDNFESELQHLKATSDNALMQMKLDSILEELQQLKDYKDGVMEYTDGVKEANDGSVELQDGIRTLKNKINEFLDENYSVDISNLTQMITKDHNPRIHASADDQVINKFAGMIAGVIVMILFTYVISVFVVHGIEKESSVIGALYALGVKKKELMKHYLMLPVFVTLIGGLIGTMLGFSKFGITVQMAACYDYFSVPHLATVYPVYLIIYGVVMPPLAAVIVNCLVIHRKLGKTALSLMKNEQKQSKVRQLDLGSMGFIRRFQIRQMVRELRTGFTVLFGMLIALIIFMLGIDCFTMCNHISKEAVTDTKYEFMYTYKYPEVKVPEGGAQAYAKTLKKEIYGYDLDVTLLGLKEDNPYFSFPLEEGMSNITISSAMAQKYHLKAGDQIVLSDEEEDREYAFTVNEVTQYSTGLIAFMDIDSMRELFRESDSYYNVVFSDHELTIPSGRLYAVTSKADVEKRSNIFIQQMRPMITMLLGLSAVVFCIVLYLMMKVMIDRSAFHISLIKIFGFRTSEIRKLYLNGNFYLIAIGAAIGIPLSKMIMDTIYPILISNVGCAMNLSLQWYVYVIIYATVIMLYLFINKLLMKKIQKMVPAEVLKNRE